MPITYVVDEELNIVRTRWSGDVTQQDVLDYFAALHNDPVALRSCRTITDVRGANLAFTGAQFGAAIRTVQAWDLGGRVWKNAIVVDSKLMFGVARQYGALAQAFSTDVIFDDHDAALQWLIRDE